MTLRRGISRLPLSLALALCSVASHGQGAAPAVAAIVEQPRSFGHVLGDVLHQRVLLRDASTAAEPATLPAAERTGPWLERRPPHLEAGDDGRRWLVINYQVVNSPRAITLISLPALSVVTRSGAALAIPAWPVSIGPLTPPETGEQAALQADRPVALRPTFAIERQMHAALASFGGLLTAWLAWWGWRQHQESTRLPFARAWQTLRQADPADPAAWLALHRALNDTAGRVVPAAGLPALLAEAPQLQPLASELERFYAASSERFFVGEAGASTFPLRALAHALRAAERQHRR